MDNGSKARSSTTSYMQVAVRLNKKTGNIHLYNTKGPKKLLSTVSNDPASDRYHGHLHKQFTDFLKSGKYSK